jgi:hypothetical protein
MRFLAKPSLMLIATSKGVTPGSKFLILPSGRVIAIIAFSLGGKDKIHSSVLQ